MHVFSKLWMLLLIPILGFAPIQPEQERLSLKGAWELTEVDGEKVGEGVQTVRIFSDTYSMTTKYNHAKKEFIQSYGGPYLYDGKKVTFTVDYHTADTSTVGKTAMAKVKIDKKEPTGNRVIVKGLGVSGNKINQVWKRIDKGEQPLAGAWQITRRMGRGGEMRTMKRGPRKTVKILSGTRFQWTAMNTATKEFLGCGGGTYTFENGKYVETIEFFSRDASRVGMSLSFDGKIEEGEWHHSGKSSKGMPIMEVWAKD